MYFRNKVASISKSGVFLISVLTFAFTISLPVKAQETDEAKKSTRKEMPFTQHGVSKALLDEYQSILNAGMVTGKNGRRVFDSNKFTEQERERLEAIYKMMSREQQLSQPVFFIPPANPLPRIRPTAAQLDAWKDDKTYGVWVDNKRIKNTDLNNYMNTDFSSVFISRLSPVAVNYGKHYYQVDLMTNDRYETYYKDKLKDNRNLMVYRRLPESRYPPEGK